MKKYILWALALTFTLGACYEDDSTDIDYSMLKNTNVDMVNPYERLTLKFMAEKTFAPVFRYTGDTTNFTPEDYAKYDYRWRLALNPGNASDTTRLTIGTGYPLVTKVAHQPAVNYSLLLEMTEKATGMKCLFTWSTNVESGDVGQGLLVAYTRDNGATSDMALLRGYHYVSNNTELLTPDSLGQMPKALIMYDVFSKANGGIPANGVISSIMGSGKTSIKLLDIVVRDKHYYRLDPNTFKINQIDNQLFMFKPLTWAPKNAYAVPVADNWTRVFCINGTSAHQFQISSGQQYGALNVTDTAFAIHPDVCVTTSSTSFGAAQYFDTKRGRIVGMGTGNVQTLTKQPNMGVFAIDELSAFEPLYAGVAQNSPWTSVWVLKEKASGKRYCYIVRNASTTSPYGNFGAAIMDMEGCTDFDRSTAWATSLKVSTPQYGANTGSGWLYYAAGNKVYSVEVPQANQSAGAPPLTPAAKHVFSIAAEEEITHLRWHLENGSVFWERNSSGFPVWKYNNTNYSRASELYFSRNRLLTIASYNSTSQEGKIYAVPCSSPANGILIGDGTTTTPDDPVWGQYVGQWGGFGKITALGFRNNF